ncbi:MAG: hypothetical protein ACRD24_15540, partial [Terriglobales bacterium]
MTTATKSAAPQLADLPSWARQLSEKYYSRAFALFVLHGNVRDLVALKRAGKTEYLSLVPFLQDALFGSRDLVLTYDRGGGISFAQRDMQQDFSRAIAGYDTFHGTSFSQTLPRTTDAVLNLIDSYLRLRLQDGKKIALILDFAETLAPAGDVSGMSAEDRNALVILKRWAHNTAFLRSDVTICLIAENQVELNAGILQHPGVAPIHIPLPEEQDRQHFSQHHVAATPLPEGSDVTAPTLGKLSGGLKRVQLQSLIAHAVQNRQPLTMKLLSQRKKELIEAESGGLLEFVQSRFDLSMVAGHAPAKKKLLDAAAAIRAGRTD